MTVLPQFLAWRLGGRITRSKRFTTYVDYWELMRFLIRDLSIVDVAMLQKWHEMIDEAFEAQKQKQPS